MIHTLKGFSRDYFFVTGLDDLIADSEVIFHTREEAVAFLRRHPPPAGTLRALLAEAYCGTQVRRLSDREAIGSLGGFLAARRVRLFTVKPERRRASASGPESAPEEEQSPAPAPRRAPAGGDDRIRVVAEARVEDPFGFETEAEIEDPIAFEAEVEVEDPLAFETEVEFEPPETPAEEEG